MNNKLLKLLSTFALTASISIISHAADNSENIEQNIDISAPSVSQEELAAIQVLHEICPALINKSEEDAFNQGFNRLITDYMPNEKQPVQALEQLSKSKDFQKFLSEARSDAEKAGDEQNRAVCADVKDYQP